MHGSSASSPLSDAETADLFAPLQQAGTLLVAVSGGPDSTALLHLLRDWVCAGPVRPALHAVTFDHGLRPESAEEAAMVAVACRALDVPHHLLRWTEPRPETGLQEQARAARYAAFDALGARLGASHLLTGHTCDDQAETVLMRLARGSGLGGLGGMKPERYRASGVCHARPFLTISKSRLLATCAARGWSYVQDPSNADPRFLRVQARALMPMLAGLGLDAAGFARFARRAQDADAALDMLARQALEAHGLDAEDGFRLDARALMAHPPEIWQRALGLAIRRVAGAEDAAGFPPLGKLERLSGEIRMLLEADPDVRVGRVLGGCALQLARGAIRIVPEGPRRRGRTSPDVTG